MKLYNISDRTLQKIVKFTKPFDKRSSDPNKNYGVESVCCFMILKGEKGAVQFCFSTGIYLPHIINEWKEKGYYPEPMGYDVGYHSPVPMYEGQKPMDSCDLLDTCYYDGSSRRAQEWFEIFLKEGYEVIWKMLEEEYESRFYARGI